MANRDISLSIIIPFYNESGNVKPLIESINTSLKMYDTEIIAIDDGSTDETLNELKESIDEHNNLTIIEFTRNFGQSAAFQAGFDHAKNDFIITMDGDLQNDPRDIINMINAIHEADADMVVGWRKKRMDNLMRKIPSMIANRILASMLNLKIHDTGCSLKLIKRGLLEDIRLYGEMHRFIPYLAYAKGAKITEIQVNHRKRRLGKTKYGLSRTFKVILDMITVKFLNEFSTNPIYAIGGLSIFTFMLSIISFIGLIVCKIFMNIDMTGNPLLIISIFLFLIGIQLLMLGLLSEIQIRTYFESNKKEIYKARRIFNAPEQK